MSVQGAEELLSARGTQHVCGQDFACPENKQILLYEQGGGLSGAPAWGPSSFDVTGC